jgi:hypothetical protein
LVEDGDEDEHEEAIERIASSHMIEGLTPYHLVPQHSQCLPPSHRSNDATTSEEDPRLRIAAAFFTNLTRSNDTKFEVKFMSVSIVE